MGGREERPVDHGWSWVICFACFVIIFCMGMALQALAVLFLELVEEFGSSVTVTSLTVMFYIMSLSVSSLVSTSILVPRFNERRVIVVSGFVFASCSVAFSVAPNIGLFIAIAALQGTSVGMVFVPAIGLLSHYFNKRRSLATTISNSGLCIASIVGPPFIRVITSEFGMRGTFLVLAGIELHLSAAGLLMRPLSFYRDPPAPKDSTLIDESEKALMKDSCKDTVDPPEDGKTDSEKEKELTSSNDKSKANDANSVPGSPTDVNVGSSKRRFFSRMDSQISYIYTEAADTSNFLERERFDSVSSDKFRQTEGHPRKYSVGQRSNKSHYSSDWSMTHKHTGPVAHHESMLSIPSMADSTTLSKRAGSSACCLIWFFKRVFDPELLKQWAFRLFLVSAIPSASCQYLLQYMATITVVQGATKSEAATLLTILGSVDLVSRLAIGFFADTNTLRPTQIVAITQICLGIVCQFNPLFRTFESMIAMVVLVGMFVGSRQSMIPLVHIEIVGVEKMSRCLSISAMIITISAAAHSPMLSAMMEKTGSFVVPLYYVGVTAIVGAVALLFIPLLLRYDNKQELKRQAAHAGEC